MHSVFLSVRSSRPDGRAEGQADFCSLHIRDVLRYQIPAAERITASQEPTAGAHRRHVCQMENSREPRAGGERLPQSIPVHLCGLCLSAGLMERWAAIDTAPFFKRQIKLNHRERSNADNKSISRLLMRSAAHFFLNPFIDYIVLRERTEVLHSG